MAKSEARLTEEAGAPAAVRAKPQARRTQAVSVEAATTRDGTQEIPRADGRDNIDDADERDRFDEPGMTDDEYLSLFRDNINQSVLPDLPKIPGYHTFWATTTNSRDTITNRLRLGYTYLKASELPGWNDNSIKTGEYEGCIGINEMIAMKIPDRRYQLYMQEVHHRAPLAEEEKIRATVAAHGENALRDKGRIVDEDGFSDNIVQKAPVPRFA